MGCINYEWDKNNIKEICIYVPNIKVLYNSTKIENGRTNTFLNNIYV